MFLSAFFRETNCEWLIVFWDVLLFRSLWLQRGAHLYNKTITEDVFRIAAFINHFFAFVNNWRKHILRTSQGLQWVTGSSAVRNGGCEILYEFSHPHKTFFPFLGLPQKQMVWIAGPQCQTVINSIYLKLYFHILEEVYLVSEAHLKIYYTVRNLTRFYFNFLLLVAINIFLGFFLKKPWSVVFNPVAFSTLCFATCVCLWYHFFLLWIWMRENKIEREQSNSKLIVGCEIKQKRKNMAAVQKDCFKRWVSKLPGGGGKFRSTIRFYFAHSKIFLGGQSIC